MECSGSVPTTQGENRSIHVAKCANWGGLVSWSQKHNPFRSSAGPKLSASPQHVPMFPQDLSGTSKTLE